MDDGNNGEIWKSYIGKPVRVVFKDDKGIARVRDGMLQSVTDGLLFIEQPRPYPALAVAISAVLRIEVRA